MCRAFPCRARMMLSYSFYLFIILHSFSKIADMATAAATPAYSATDLILLNCGASSNLKDTNRRTWDSDNVSSHLVSVASNMRSSVSKVPYEVATFFRSRFTHSFPLQTAGTKFLRLHFHPTIYSDFNTSESFFSVTANGFNLLSNFSAYLYSGGSSFAKEFVININGNRNLDLTFYPNPNSFAFINGIEIVSSPDGLYFRGNDVPIRFVDQLFYLANSTVLENVFRLNVGGRRVAIEEDSGMFRAWSSDDEYIYSADFGWVVYRENVSIKYTAHTPAYSAPEIVYMGARVMRNTSKSLEWGFPVNSGFYYLLRFHFCEFTWEVTKQNERVFTIRIDNQTMEFVLDVIFVAGGPQTPIFMDYVVWVPDLNGRRQLQDMRLSLNPCDKTKAKYLSASLNGLEIFKLNDTKGSLAAANPDPVFSSPPPKKLAPPQKKKSLAFFIVIGSAVAILAAVTLLFSQRRRKVLKQGSRVSSPSQPFRYFSLQEIKTATSKFDQNLVIGRGGFGYVYKGLINRGTTTVAVKRLNPSSNQGEREFQTEIEMLSKLRHLNLVSLLGYCDDNGEMILVYDYMSRGTLRSHLYYISKNPPLTWKQRLQICLGAARGLHYLHTGTEHAVIHRDVKTSNILLDEKWVAKMSDFGLSKVGHTAGGPDTHVSTTVKGSIGYVDPEYYRRRRLTEKSDVYSFGVVLFEVLCARPAIIPELPREEINLGEWAKFCFMEGRLEQIIDPNLEGQIASECLSKFAETAASCLSDRGIDRPAMGDVVGGLELAVQLQEEDEIESGGSSLVGGHCGTGSSIAQSVEYDSSDFEHV